LKIHSKNIILSSVVFLLILFLFIPAKADNKEVEKIQQELILAIEDTTRARLLNDAAFLLRSTNPKLSLIYANNALELSTKAKYQKGILNAYLVKGIIYKRFGDFENAMKNYLSALQIADTLGDKTRISSCYNNIGSIYQGQNNNSQAILYFRKSLDIEKVLGKKDQVSIRLYNIGTVYESMNKLDSAIECYNSSLEIEEALKNDEGISYALYGLGGVLTKKGDFAKAETTLMKAYELAKKNNNVSDISYCMNELGVLYMKWKKFDQAISCFLKSVSSADSIGEKSQMKESYFNLAHTYAELGNYKNAYDYFSKYNILNEEINNSEISRKIAEINSKYEVDKADREVELLKKESQIKELEYNQQKSLRNYLLFTSIIVIIIGFFRYRKNITAKKDEQRNVFVFESLFLSGFVWSIIISIYTIIYFMLIQPFGLSALHWSEKWLIIAVYGAISLAMILLSFLISSIWNNFFRRQIFILRYIAIAIINIVLLSAALFIYNVLQHICPLNLSSFAEALLQISIISILPFLILMLFSERITYAQNLKDIPIESVTPQPVAEPEIPKPVEEKRISIKTDNIGESLQLTQSQIVCFEANDNYTAIYYLYNNKLKKELYRITLKKLEVQFIEFKEIIRCHKSYIINLTHLERISGNAQAFKMHLKYLDFEIPVSRSFPRQIIDNLKKMTSIKDQA